MTATDANVLQWVKLLLEPNGLQVKDKKKIQRIWTTYELMGSHKRPVDVVADYLKWYVSEVELGMCGDHSGQR